MIKISKTLEKIIENDHDAYVACQRGILNLSAYARTIKNEVEKLTKKSVNLKSIVVGLSRIQKEIKKTDPQESAFKVINLSIQTDLEELTYEKTTENIKLFREVYTTLTSEGHKYLTATQGLNEITIIGETLNMSGFKTAFNKIKPLFNKNGLAGITVKFPANLINVPNAIFHLIKKLAIKKINIIEVVSTFSELTFIIDQADTETAVTQLTKELN